MDINYYHIAIITSNIELHKKILKINIFSLLYFKSKRRKTKFKFRQKVLWFIVFLQLDKWKYIKSSTRKKPKLFYKIEKKNLVKNLKFANLFFIWISFLQEVQQIYLFFRRRKKIIKWYWNMIEIRLEGVGFSKKRVFFGFLLDNFFCFAMKKVVNEKRLLGLKVMNRNALV